MTKKRDYNPHYDPPRVRDMPFKELPRFNKLASAFYPDQTTPEVWREMQSILRKEGWGKPGKPLLDPAIRGSVSPLGGTAVQPRKR